MSWLPPQNFMDPSQSLLFFFVWKRRGTLSLLLSLHFIFLPFLLYSSWFQLNKNETCAHEKFAPTQLSYREKKKRLFHAAFSHHRGEKQLSLFPLEEFFCVVLAGRPEQFICGNEYWNILFKQAGASCEMLCLRFLVLHCHDQHVLNQAECDLLGFHVQ